MLMSPLARSRTVRPFSSATPNSVTTYSTDVAAKLNVDVLKLLCCYTYGDQITNIIQPFWALPYLTLCHIDLRGYCPARWSSASARLLSALSSSL